MKIAANPLLRDFGATYAIGAEFIDRDATNPAKELDEPAGAQLNKIPIRIKRHEP
jgi:hypothetical protein